MVFELELQGLRVALALGFAVLVHALGVRHRLAERRGWALLVLGLLTLVLGFLLDLLAALPQFNRFVVLGGGVEAELVRLLAYGTGFVLVGAGFAMWIPEVAEVAAGREAAEAARRSLEARVEARTAELTRADRALHEQLRAGGAHEAAARLAEERLREVAAAAPEVLYLAEPGPEGYARFLLVSPGVQALWGLSAEDLDRDPPAWAAAVHPEDREAALAAWARPARSFRQSFRVVRPDGTVRWVEEHASAILDAGGRVARVAGVARDVTERAEAEQALRASEAKYRSLLGRVPDTVVTLSEDGTVRFASPGVAAFGYVEDEFCSAAPGAFLERVHADDRPLVAAALRRLFSDGKALDTQFRLVRRNGGLAWVRARATGVYEQAGLRLADATLADVTALRAARAAQWAAEEQLASFASRLHDALWLVDLRSGQVLRSNTAYEAIFGRPSRELTKDPRAWLAAVHTEDRERVRRALDAEQPGPLEFRVALPGGAVRRVHADVVRVRDAAGEPRVEGGMAVDLGPERAVPVAAGGA